MLSDKQYVLQECHKLEMWLKKEGAHGKSIKQMALSLDDKLSYDIKMAIKHVNHIRHQFATQSDPSIGYGNMMKFQENMIFLNHFFNPQDFKKENIYDNVRDLKETWDNASTLGKVGMAGLGLVALFALGS